MSAPRITICRTCGKERWAPLGWNGVSDPGPCGPCQKEQNPVSDERRRDPFGCEDTGD